MPPEQVLVTGSRVGLGEFLCRRLGAVGLTRQNSSDLLPQHFKSEFKTIIHCANDDTDGILLQNILKLKHNQFVFFSSSDVYPDDEAIHFESEVIDAGNARSPYAKEKLSTEANVLKFASNPLIIRPSGLLGSARCGENLRKLLVESSPVLTLTEDSLWNFVTYEETLKVLCGLIAAKRTGPVNLARAESVRVKTIADYLGKSPVFGNHKYRVANLNIDTVFPFAPELKQSSLDSFKNWLALNRNTNW